MKFLLLSILIFSFYCQSYQWNDFGHMLATQILQTTLNSSNSSLFSTFSSLVLGLNNLTFGKSQTFVQSAPWANDLETRGFTFLNTWHFSNQVLNASNPPNSSNLAQINLELSEEDLSYGLYYCEQVLTKKSIQQKIRFENAMMSRYLLHLAQDAHQPLHCATLYSPNLPYGDLFGQFYNITVPTLNYTGNLYNLWNAGLLNFPNFSRPLPQTNISYIEQMAANITNKYPQSFFGSKVQDTDWNNWISQSYLTAWNHVYSPLLNSLNQTTITQSYLNVLFFILYKQNQTAYPIVEQQIALSAYRLAYWIQQMYNNTSQANNNLENLEGLFDYQEERA